MAVGRGRGIGRQRRRLAQCIAAPLLAVSSNAMSKGDAIAIGGFGWASEWANDGLLESPRPQRRVRTVAARRRKARAVRSRRVRHQAHGRASAASDSPDAFAVHPRNATAWPGTLQVTSRAHARERRSSPPWAAARSPGGGEVRGRKHLRAHARYYAAVAENEGVARVRVVSREGAGRGAREPSSRQASQHPACGRATLERRRSCARRDLSEKANSITCAASIDALRVVVLADQGGTTTGQPQDDCSEPAFQQGGERSAYSNLGSLPPRAPRPSRLFG